MARWLWFVLGLAVACSANRAQADVLRATLGGELRELSHSVKAVVADGVARYQVRRVFRNEGKASDEVDLQIVLVAGAAATGLRVQTDQGWRSAALVDAEQASERYQGRGGRNDGQPSALLEWVSETQLILRVHPLAPGKTCTVEYTLSAPTRYQHGRVILSYPRALPAVDANAGTDWERAPSLPLAVPVLTLHASWGHTRAEVLIDNQPAKLERAVSLVEQPDSLPEELDDAEEGEITWELDAAVIKIAKPSTHTALRLGEVPSGELAIKRLEIDLATELSALPRRAQLVFVVDASYSQRAAGLAAQLALITRYLRYLPDAEVALVAYRRTAQQLGDGFLPAARVPALLAKATQSGALALGNGSELEQGVKLGSSLLRGRKGPLRMIIASDALLRPGYANGPVLAQLARLPGRAIVHVVVPYLGGEQDELQRDTDHPLAPLAAAHHGMFSHAYLSDPELRPDGRVSAVLGLVRAVQIDQLQIVGLSEDAQSEYGQLREGESLRITDHQTQPSGQLTIRGLLWGDRWQRVVHASPHFTRASAAWLFSQGDCYVLDDDQQRPIAQLARSVSPVTSYLLTSPGRRPEPLVQPYDVNGDSDCWTHGDRGRSTRIGNTRAKPSLQELLASQAAACRAQHAIDHTVTLEVDTTLDEVVDVQAAHTAAPAELVQCLSEAVWSVRLDGRFWLAHDHFTVTFGK